MAAIVPFTPLALRADVVAVPFLDGHIPCVQVDGEPMVVLKPVSDLLGLRWAPQHAKLSADQMACITFIVMQMPGDDQARKHMAVSLETFTLWLGGLQPSRVRAEARDTVLAYKREAGRALRNHFFGAQIAQVGSDLDVIQGMLDAIRVDRARLTAIEAKVAAIEGAHDWFTALGFARLHGHPTGRPYLAKVGKLASGLMRDQGREPQRRQDATFGAINVYPADVLEQAFGLVTR